jgi:hypothetical protein
MIRSVLSALVCVVTLYSRAPVLAQTPPTVNAVPFISEVTPPSLPVTGNAGSGSATLTILGANFSQNAVVNLTFSGTTVIHATSTTVNSTGSAITAQFTGNVPSAPAVFGVTVTNPNGTAPITSNVFYLPQTSATPSVLLNQDATYPLAGSPQALLASDLQANGLPSLAIVSQNPDSVSTELDIYSGFESGYVVTTGQRPYGIATGEFLLGDNLPEFAVTNSSDNTISLVVANGTNGSYRAFSTVSLPGVFPTGLVAGDFNRDGILDLAVVNTCGSQTPCFPQAAPLGPGSVTILLGNGDGTFSVSPAQLVAGNIPYAIAAADLNGDGILDLVVANSTSNTLSVFLGNGDGTFIAATASPATGNGPMALAIADFNNDGFLDIAVANSNDNTVSILLNQNCPSVAPAACTFAPASVSPSVPGAPIAIATGDLNADGFLDLVVANASANMVTVLLGNGTGAFTAVVPPQNSPNFSTGSAPDGLVLADFNQDGRLDIITSNRSGSYSLLRQAAVMGLQLTANPSTFVYGSVPILTVQLMPPPGAPASPTGTITLFDGSTQVTSTTLSGNGNQFQFMLPPTYFFGAGTHQLTAVYSGDTNFAPVTSNAVTETVMTSSTTTTLSSNVTNAPYGTSVTLTAGILAQLPAPATGTVTFIDTTNSTTLGTATISNNSAQLTLTNLTAGAHAILASYQGDGNCASSSSSILSVNITQASTTLTISESPSQAQFAQPVRLTASLQFSGNNPATGTITFYDGASSLGTVSVSSNSATLSISTLSVGTHAISAQYSGDSNFLSSSGNATETITPCSTTVTLTAGINPSVYGSYISMSATITPAYGSFPVEGVTSGQVAFYDGTTLLGTQNIEMSPALLSVQTLTAGTHTLTAQWLGNANYAPSTSNAVSQTVTQASSTTSVYTLKNPCAYGQSVTVDVAVDNTYHLASSGGTITLFDNGTQIATGAMSQGIAFFPLTTLAVGAHSLTASYSGDNDLKPSTSTAFTQNVSQATTTTSVSLSASSINFGQSATLTATVQPAYTGTPTGAVTFLDGTTTLGISTMTNGSAQFTVSALTPGTHSISAKYSGDTNFTASNSTASQTLTVNQATTTTTVSTSSNPSTYGQLVTFSATVQTGSGTGPTGSVTFLNGTTTLGTVPLSNGTAQLAISSLAAGSQSVTAQYSGDSNFAGSTSSALVETVNPAVTSTVIAANANPATFGQAVTLSATVQPPSGSTAIGTITFLDGANTLGTATLTNNNAQLTLSTLAVGAHSMTAVYSGSANFAASTSPVLTETISQAATATTVTASPNPSMFNQWITFVVTVSPSSGGTPTGTVTLMDGTTNLSAATLAAGGPARIMYSGLMPGTHSITAVYSGDANFTASTSAAVNETVNPASTTTVVSSNLNPSTYGQAVTLTATVQAPQGINPFGTVTFMDGSATVGSSNLLNGSAQLTLSGLAAGSHAITAVYGGNTYLTGSTSANLAQSVSTASSATTISSSANPAAFGQTVVLSATIQPVFGGSATGTVMFLDGTVALGSSPVSGNAAQLSLSSLTIGSHSITAKYSGDSNVAGSTSTAFAQTVNQAATTTTVTSGSNPAIYGPSVTFSVKVQSSSSGTPTGTVTLLDGSNSLGNTALPANGVAQFTISSLAPGAHAISASYSGDTNFAPSSAATLTETINQASTTTTVTSATNPAMFDQSVVFSVKVQSSSSGTPTGTVTLLDGSNSLGSTALPANGVAQFTISSLALGSHAISASYSGDTNFATSTAATLTETINQASTTITVTSGTNPSAFDQTVTFTVKIQPSSGGTPTGTVTLLDGSSSLGSTSLPTSGVVQFTISTLLVGSHSITATYGGDNYFLASASAALGQTVNQAPTTTAVTSSANPSSYGQALTFTASVATSFGGSPTGTITFFDGATQIGSASVSGGFARFTTGATALNAGAHSIVASYSGDANFTGSSSAAWSQTVNAVATATTLVSNLNPSVFGQLIIFTATVSSSVGGTQSGSVSFYVDRSSTPSQTSTLSGGAAQFSTSSLAGGTHSVIATFASTNSNFQGSSSAVLTQNVEDFSVFASPASLTISRGHSGTTTLTVSPVLGFTGSVSLSCSGAPANDTCSLSPTQVSLSGSPVNSTVTVHATQKATAGNYTLTLTGVSGSISHTTRLTLTVQ